MTPCSSPHPSTPSRPMKRAAGPFQGGARRGGREHRPLLLPGQGRYRDILRVGDALADHPRVIGIKESRRAATGDRHRHPLQGPRPGRSFPAGTTSPSTSCSGAPTAGFAVRPTAWPRPASKHPRPRWRAGDIEAAKAKFAEAYGAMNRFPSSAKSAAEAEVRLRGSGHARRRVPRPARASDRGGEGRVPQGDGADPRLVTTWRGRERPARASSMGKRHDHRRRRRSGNYRGRHRPRPPEARPRRLCSLTGARSGWAPPGQHGLDRGDRDHARLPSRGFTRSICRDSPS